MGKTMGTCFHFGEVGGSCLGRVLAGLDPSTEEASTWLPYFIEGIEHDAMRSALHLAFGAVCDRHSNHASSLLLSLGRIVHHSDFLKGAIDNNSGYTLGNTRILNGTDLLCDLKHLATAKLSDRMAPTRAPPRAHQLKNDSIGAQRHK